MPLGFIELVSQVGEGFFVYEISPFRFLSGLLSELVGHIHQNALPRAEISRSIGGQGNEITGSALIGFRQSELRPLVDEKLGNFSLPFDWLGRNGPDVGVVVEVLSQKPGPFEVPIQQLTEVFEVQFPGVKRVFETRFVGINNLVGSGNDE